MRRTRLLLAIAGALALSAPFGEGGSAPLAMMALHALALAFIVVTALGRISRGSGFRARGPTAAALVLLACGLTLAALSTLGAGYPLAGWLGLWDLLVAAGLFVAALHAGLPERHGPLLRNLLVASTGLQASLAVVRGISGGIAAAGESFLNPNHLAAFVAFGLMLCLGAADAARASRSRAAAGLWISIAAVHLLAVAILASRGAFLAIGVASLLFVAPRARGWPRGSRAAAAAGLVLIAAIGAGSLAARFSRAEDPYRYHRLSIWKASLAMLARRPLLGFGPGLFKHHSPAFNFPITASPIRYGRLFSGAHSAPLTLAVETGVPAAASLLACAALLALELLRRRDGRVPSGVEAGVGLALAALLAQGIVDDLQTRPALTLLPALAVGVALGAPGRRREEDGAAGRAPARAARPALLGFVLTAAVYLAAGAILLPYLAHREAGLARRLGRGGVARMASAARLNPLHPDYRHDLAMAELNAGPLEPERYARAALLLEQARRLKPIDYRFPLLMARLESRVGERAFEDAAAAARAASLYREAARLAPLDPRPLLELAGHLSARGREAEALEALERAVRLEPHFHRAHLLRATILLRIGDQRGAARALESLSRSRRRLASYEPASSYERDLLMVPEAEIERIEAWIRAAAAAAPDAASR
ncbi:MAG: O-antigen ligase family protein [Acidobacteriota bacterium]